MADGPQHVQRTETGQQLVEAQSLQLLLVRNDGPAGSR